MNVAIEIFFAKFLISNTLALKEAYYSERPSYYFAEI
jgi:hypothetical protein